MNPLENENNRNTEETLYSGEIKLIISPPVNLKTISRLFSYLQTLQDVKLVYTSGSRESDMAITIAVDKPTPVLSLLTKIEGVSLATVPSTEEHQSEKTRFLIEKKTAQIKEIRLVLKE